MKQKNKRCDECGAFTSRLSLSSALGGRVLCGECQKPPEITQSSMQKAVEIAEQMDSARDKQRGGILNELGDHLREIVGEPVYGLTCRREQVSGSYRDALQYALSICNVQVISGDEVIA